MLNNPLLYTDPTGYWGKKEQGYLRLAVAIAISVYTGGQSIALAANGAWGQAMAVAFIGGMSAGMVQSGSGRGALVGGVTSVAFVGIGGYYNQLPTAATTGEALSRYAQRALVTGVAGGVLATIQGQRFGSGFASAGLGSALNPLSGYAGDSGFAQGFVAAIVGGTVSEATGGKFANGAVTAAFAYAVGRVVRANTYQSVGPEDGVMVDPTPDGAGRERLNTFNEALEAAGPSGIVFGSGTSVTYIDEYAFSRNGEISFCTKNCSTLLDEFGIIAGEFRQRQNQIRLYRAAVEPQWVSGMTGGTIWSKPLTRSGVESAILTLGHEAGHSRGIDVNMPAQNFHPNAEIEGQKALIKYRIWRGGQ